MDAMETIKEQLDRELAQRPGVGIAFGLDLFEEFAKRGWIELHNPNVWPFNFPMPFYQKTHYAFALWTLPDLAYQLPEAANA